MSPLLTILRFTLQEYARRRLMLVLALLTALALLLSAWGFVRLPTLLTTRHAALLPFVACQLLVLVMFMWSGVTVVGMGFLSAASLGGERESGVLLAVLARSVTRRQLLFGKWLSLVSLAVPYLALASALQFLIVRLTSGYSPGSPSPPSSTWPPWAWSW